MRRQIELKKLNQKLGRTIGLPDEKDIIAELASQAETIDRLKAENAQLAEKLKASERPATPAPPAPPAAPAIPAAPRTREEALEQYNTLTTPAERGEFFEKYKRLLI